MMNEEAIEVLKNDIEICTIQQQQACDMAIKALEQQPKVGKWIDTGIGKEEFYGEMFVCSECNGVSYYENYCPNCGADMREGEK